MKRIIIYFLLIGFSLGTFCKSNKLELNITPKPLEVFKIKGCGCLYYLEADSILGLYFAQSELDGTFSSIVLNNTIYNLNFISRKLVEREKGVEHSGDSIVEIWENDSINIKYKCLKIFTCNDDSESRNNENCEVTKFKGKAILKYHNKSKEYLILGDCGC
jgi:hypothetical protein